MNPQTVTIGDTQIRFLSTVKGLVSEADIVEAEIESFKPDLVALSIGPEEIKGTREWDGQPYDMSGWDEIYGLSLREEYLSDYPTNIKSNSPTKFTRGIV